MSNAKPSNRIAPCCRRTRSLFLNANAALEAAPKVAPLMARELEYDSNWESTQLAAFERVARHFRVQKRPRKG